MIRPYDTITIINSNSCYLMWCNRTFTSSSPQPHRPPSPPPKTPTTTETHRRAQEVKKRNHTQWYIYRRVCEESWLGLHFTIIGANRSLRKGESGPERSLPLRTAEFLLRWRHHRTIISNNRRCSNLPQPICPSRYMAHNINLLKTKRNLLYIRNQSVQRSKLSPPRL